MGTENYSIPQATATNAGETSGITRRTVLSVGAAGALGAVLTAGARPGMFRGVQQTGWDTIVVGAGAAGLGAARVLADAGKRVLILEARDRIGGRMWTSQMESGTVFERGAELVHGAAADGVSTWEIIDALGIDTHRQSDVAGRNSPGVPWVSGDLPSLAFPHGSPIALADLPEAGDGETALAWLERCGIFPANYPIALAAIEVDSEQFNMLPAGWVTDLVAYCIHLEDHPEDFEPEEYGGDHRVIGGYRQVLAPLVAGIPIMLEHIVQTIEWGSNGVTIETNRGTFTAANIVVALPGGVLKNGDVTFVPPLPAERQAAISQIQYLSVFKGIFEFAQPVLPAPWDVRATFSNNPPSMWNASAGTPNYSGELVVSWMTGGKAQQLLDMTPADRQNAALASIRSSAEDTSLTPLEFSFHDWSKDPFARGAYPGPFSRRSGLTDPIGGVLFWAGMVTSTIHRSRDSGIAAARAVLEQGGTVFPATPLVPATPKKPTSVETGRAKYSANSWRDLAGLR